MGLFKGEMADLINNLKGIGTTFKETDLGKSITNHISSMGDNNSLAGSTSTQNSVELFQPTLSPVTSSNNNSQSNSNNTSSNSSASGGTSKSQSGIDFDNPFIKNLMPLINNSVNNLSGDIDTWTQSAADKAESEARSLTNQYLPGVLNSLANRGMLNSSVGSASMTGLLKSIAENSAQKNYDASMQAAQMKQSIPTLLGQLAELGRRSSGTSSNWSTGQGTSTGTSTGNSIGSSYSSNPLAPYELIANMYLGMM